MMTLFEATIDGQPVQAIMIEGREPVNHMPYDDDTPGGIEQAKGRRKWAGLATSYRSMPLSDTVIYEGPMRCRDGEIRQVRGEVVVVSLVEELNKDIEGPSFKSELAGRGAPEIIEEEAV